MKVGDMRCKAFRVAACLLFAGGASFASDDSMLMMPEGARMEFAEDGNFLINGKPRFLIGNLYYAHYGTGELVRGPGYSEKDAWIYESIPDRAYLQRLGFDTSGGEVSSSWIGKYRIPRRHYQARNCIEWGVASNYWNAGLPMVVDFTCATWSHGGISHVKGVEPVERAFVKDCHFMYYSLVTPEGRSLWQEMWRSGAEELKANGAKPYVYELFNEPYYDDRSPYARKAFAAYLSRKWKGDAAAMDKAWGTSYGSFAAAAEFKSPNDSVGLGVEWHKFREACFASGIKLGIETIRKVDPAARFAFQPLARHRSLVSVMDSYRLCEVTMTPTGGGTFYDDIVLRALSDGKPIIDGETYLGRTRKSHRSKLVTQWARGINASYYFKWERRMREIKKDNPLECLKRQGERFPWLGLNPAYVPPDELVGIMNAKRDIFAMQDLFAPRMRGIPSAQRAATLFSMPTERLGEATEGKCRFFAETTAQALALDVHVPLDAVFEEQLSSGRHDRYRFIVASGIEAVYDATPSRLEAWVKSGGILVLDLEAFGHDEWGRVRTSSEKIFPGVAVGPNAKGEIARFSFLGAQYDAVPYKNTVFAQGVGWETLTSLPDGHVAVARRRIGKGEVYYIGVRFPSRGDEGRLLASIAAKCGIFPTCTTLDGVSDIPVDGVEVHAACLPDGDTGFVLINTTLAPKAVRFIPGRRFDADVLVDISSRTLLGRGDSSAAMIALPPLDPVVLRGASSEKRLAVALAGAPSPWNGNVRGGFSRKSWKDSCDEAHRLISKDGGDDFVKPFPVDPAKIRMLDIRESANASLGNILKNPPWGANSCGGVLFDFIRPDQNSGFSCIALRSEGHPKYAQSVTGVPVNLRAGALYFLHAGIGVRGGDVIRYAIRYADGSRQEFPAKAYVDFGDVAIDGMPSTLPESVDCCPGWIGRDRRGLWVARWVNPYPEKVIASIDISANSKGTPVVAGISAEMSPDGCGAVDCAPVSSVRPWGGVKAAVAEGGAIDVDFGVSRGWPGVNVDLRKSPVLPDDAAAMDMEFEIVTDGLPPPEMQVRIGDAKYHTMEPFMRKVADGRWRVGVPFDYAGGRDVQSIGFQRRGEPKGRRTATKLRICSFRVAWRGIGDNILELRRFDPFCTESAKAIRRDGGLELAVADNNRHWASLHMRLAELMPLQEIAGKKDLVFEVNAGRTPLGARGLGRHRIRVEALFKNADGKEMRVRTEKPNVSGGRIDDDPWTWQTVRVPFSSLVPGGAVALQRFVMQLLDMPADGRSGLVFRNLRFELVAE